MKALKDLFIATGVAGGLVASAIGQPTPSTNVPAAKPVETNAPAEIPDAPDTNSVSTNLQTAVVPAAEQPAPALIPSATSPVTITPPSTNYVSYGDKGLRMNFRGVPLEMVLNYLSDAAGYTIVLETDVKGTIDAWSNQPLDKKEAVALLNSVLNKNGYAVLQDGRTLTIVSREEARKRDIPIVSGNNPSSIPKTSDVVTQIIPVRSLNAVQLVKDLAPLLPSDTTLAANDAGNSLIMTDTQTNIRRITEIIKALDSATSTINSIRIFPLQYADAKALVTVVKELFPSASSSQGGNNGNNGGGGGRMARMAAMFGGGGPGMGGGGGGATDGHTGTTRVLAVSDDASNSLIVSAPEDVLPTIEELVKSIDVTVEDITEIRVFRLKYADPQEMSDLLTQLFPDDSSSNASQQQPRFGGPGGMFAMAGGGRSASNNSNQSDRMKKKGRVIAVADQRTASVIVTSDKSLMVQIANMVEQLDSNPAKKQKVFVYSLENADVTDVEPVLDNLFQGSNSRNTTSQSQNNNVLSQRNQQLQQSTSSSSMGQSNGRLP